MNLTFIIMLITTYIALFLMFAAINEGINYIIKLYYFLRNK